MFLIFVFDEEVGLKLFYVMLFGRNIKIICLYHLTKHTKLAAYIVIVRIIKYNSCVSVSALMLHLFS